MSIFLLGVGLVVLLPFILAAGWLVEYEGPAWLAGRVGILFFRVLTRGRYPRAPLEAPQDLIIALIGAAIVGLAMFLAVLVAIPIARLVTN